MLLAYLWYSWVYFFSWDSLNVDSGGANVSGKHCRSSGYYCQSTDAHIHFKPQKLACDDQDLMSSSGKCLAFKKLTEDGTCCVMGAELFWGRDQGWSLMFINQSVSPLVWAPAWQPHIPSLSSSQPNRKLLAKCVVIMMLVTILPHLNWRKSELCGILDNVFFIRNLLKRHSTWNHSLSLS